MPGAEDDFAGIPTGSTPPHRQTHAVLARNIATVSSGVGIQAVLEWSGDNYIRLYVKEANNWRIELTISATDIESVSYLSGLLPPQSTRFFGGGYFNFEQNLKKHTNNILLMAIL
mgnify:CR=1 FL=1